MNKIEIIKEYVDKGMYVIPLHTVEGSGTCSCNQQDCKAIGKHPIFIKRLCENGSLSPTNDIEVINQIWNKYPNANIGLLTGTKSKIVVIDIDYRHDGENSLSKFEQNYGKLPPTAKVETGNGCHYYFLSPNDLKFKNHKKPLKLITTSGVFY